MLTNLKLKHLPGIFAGLALFTGSAFAQQTNNDDLKQVRDSVKEMEATIKNLNERIATLEKEEADGPQMSKTDFFGGDGFIEVPKTGMKMRFNIKLRLDMNADNRNSGNTERFVTAQIPTKGGTYTNNGAYGGGSRFNMNAKGSVFDFQALSIQDGPYKVKVHYQNDFYDRGNQDLNYRIKLLYASIGNLSFGRLLLPFENPEIWPETVDAEGVNSVVYSRAIALRYDLPMKNGWSSAFAISKQSVGINYVGIVDRIDRLPDLTANIRWEREDFGHVMLSGIGRYIKIDDGPGGDQDVFGWGLNLTSVIKLGAKDELKLGAAIGQGIFSHYNDYFVSADVGYQGTKLKALTTKSLLFGYTHHWNDNWRSTASYGLIQLNNETSPAGGLVDNQYYRTQYASANVVYRVGPRFDVGFEVLYGRQKLRNSDYGDVYRAQLSFLYSLF